MDSDNKNIIDALIFVCIQGSITILVDGKNIEVNANEVAALWLNTSFNLISITPDFKCKIIGFAPGYIERIMPNTTSIWYKALYMHQNVKINFGEENIKSLEKDIEFFKSKLALTSARYYDIMIKNYLTGLFCEMASRMDELIDLEHDEREVQSQELICRKFLELLANTKPRPRLVAWYSNQLCITPKYLSFAVKSVSGKNASDWIQDAVTTEIRELLLKSTKSIKEICNELDFKNISFFGRYVKRYIGHSPRNFRRIMQQ